MSRGKCCVVHNLQELGVSNGDEIYTSTDLCNKVRDPLHYCMYASPGGFPGGREKESQVHRRAGILQR